MRRLRERERAHCGRSGFSGRFAEQNAHRLHAQPHCLGRIAHRLKRAYVTLVDVLERVDGDVELWQRLCELVLALVLQAA